MPLILITNRLQRSCVLNAWHLFLEGYGPALHHKPKNATQKEAALSGSPASSWWKTWYSVMEKMIAQHVEEIQ